MSSDVMKLINNVRRPLIGLEYIAILINSDDTHSKDFKCLMCRYSAKAALPRHILKHVESVEHQLTYLIHHFPSVSGDLYRARAPIKQRTIHVYAICDAIERKYGRKQPQYLQAEKYHRAHRNNLTHFDESMGTDFMDVLRRCQYNSRQCEEFCFVKIHAGGLELLRQTPSQK